MVSALAGQLTLERQGNLLWDYELFASIRYKRSHNAAQTELKSNVAVFSHSNAKYRILWTLINQGARPDTCIIFTCTVCSTSCPKCDRLESWITAEDLVQRNHRDGWAHLDGLWALDYLLRRLKTRQRCEKAGVHLPTTVSNMLSRSRATKTMKRMSFLDCLSSLSHLSKWNCRSASNLPMMLVPKGENRGMTSPSAKRRVPVMGQ